MLSIQDIRASENFNFADASTVNNITATKQKIDSFAALPSGWHYGEGITPLPSAIANAHDWHERLVRARFLHTDAFPGADGEILIAAYHDNHNIELVLEADNSISLYYEEDDDPVVSLSHKTPSEIDNALGKIVGELWSTLGSFTKEISTQGKIDSTDWRLRTMEAADLSFNTYVSSRQAHHYVPTSKGITPQLLGLQQFSGYFRRINFPMGARSYNNRRNPGMIAIATITFTDFPTTNMPNF
jgi:hypothetical protein